MSMRRASKPDDGKTQSTMVHRVAETGPAPSLPSGNLDSVRSQLRRCSMTGLPSENPMRVSLQKLIENMGGTSVLKVGGVAFLAIQTRRAIFLLCKEAPEKLYEDPTFMGIDLKRRSVLHTDNGTKRYLYPVSYKELRSLQMSAARMNERPSLPPPAPGAAITDSLEPDPDRVVNTESFMKRMALCTVLKDDGSGFDAKAFAESISLATHFNDRKGSSYYLIFAGKDDECYRLYVNADSTAMPGEGITLQYGSDYCMLYKEA